MADEVEHYLATLAEPERSRIADIYAVARRMVPSALETTKGAIHLGDGQALPDALLGALIRRRVDRIDGA
jgi:hypothetical protein